MHIRGSRSSRSLLHCALVSFVLVAPALLGTALVSPASAARDPFTPEGKERIRIDIGDEDIVRQLAAEGFDIEERTRTELFLLANGVDLVRLAELGFEWSPVVYEDDTRVFTTHTAMTAELQQLVVDHPDRARLTSYGLSVQGREIWALRVTTNPDVEEFEPEVRIVGAHHGNEKMATEICMNLAHLLLEQYGVDPEITAFVDSRDIWIVPMVNPDGHTANSRYNAHSVDLNRNYGYMWDGTGSAAFSEPETRAMRDLAADNPFCLSLSFHTSGDIVNSVWNYLPDYTEDDDVVWRLTEDYAAYNGYWAVRGWYWYETHGDCNDWSYGARGDLDWTIETASSGEDAVWNANQDAILHIIDAAGWGVHGKVYDATTGEPIVACAFAEGIDWPSYTDPLVGDFHKPLLGGTYDIRVSASGYQDVVLTGVSVPADGGVTVDVPMQRRTGRYAERVEQANCPDPSNLYQNATLSMAMLGAPDNSGYSIGRGGDVVLDFGVDDALQDGAGDDLVVHESGDDALVERCDVYVSNDPFGPWTFLGVAEGTTGFDFAGTGVSSARFVYLDDDGDGVYSGAYPGYDLDAIEATWADPASVGDDGLTPSDLREMGAALETLCPNPVKSGENFQIESTGLVALPASIELLDVTGRVVRVLETNTSRRVRGEWRAIDASGHDLPSGLYLLRIGGEGGARSRKLVIVE
ncbi:MAG: T9SS type A sorting domain-containing protein [Candidatus Eisenbacteria bacterium]|uniref:T9SS type A sorting domain-containing protein n=1 Tax=Eiseniibacteriota bacterium TaxID=2212470 RepID=A0A956NBN5_UNCEI|nr:T9SS type A sorting domain-containing protein [Candidatus Eisenbacteria bacterium]